MYQFASDYGPYYLSYSTTTISNPHLLAYFDNKCTGSICMFAKITSGVCSGIHREYSQRSSIKFCTIYCDKNNVDKVDKVIGSVLVNIDYENLHSAGTNGKELTDGICGEKISVVKSKIIAGLNKACAANTDLFRIKICDKILMDMYVCSQDIGLTVQQLKLVWDKDIYSLL